MKNPKSLALFLVFLFLLLATLYLNIMPDFITNSNIFMTMIAVSIFAVFAFAVLQNIGKMIK